MPYRILANPVSIFLESMLLGAVATWHAFLAITESLTDKDWSRLLGEDGFKAALLIGIAVVWCNSERSKQQRHRELVEALALRDRQADQRVDQIVKLKTESAAREERMINAIETFDARTNGLCLKIDDIIKKLKS